MKEDAVLNVIAAARLVLSGRAAVPDEVGLEARRILGLELPLLTGSFDASSFPITEFIGDALKHGTSATRPLLEAAAPALPLLPWKYNYAPRADIPDPGRKMAWGEIVGPEAPFASDRFCLGFTLIAPHSFYPRHRHPATELYLVLAGTAEWTLDGDAVKRPPGTFILHPSGAAHSMRTFDEPLLALYTWSGADVVTLSSYL